MYFVGVPTYVGCIGSLCGVVPWSHSMCNIVWVFGCHPKPAICCYNILIIFQHVDFENHFCKHAVVMQIIIYIYLQNGVQLGAHTGIIVSQKHWQEYSLTEI